MQTGDKVRVYYSSEYRRLGKADRKRETGNQSERNLRKKCTNIVHDCVLCGLSSHVSWLLMLLPSLPDHIIKKSLFYFIFFI